MRKTIFVVDDNDINLSVAKESLKEHYRVLTMVSAEKMFSLMAKIIPDLILLDIEMPDMDGFEALQKLKENPSFAGIPVVFLTGTTDAAIEERSARLGALDIITKPFCAPDLLDHIMKISEKQ